MSKRRKVIYAIIGLVIVTMAIGTALNWRNIHMVATYNPILLPSWYSEPENQEEARLQDLDHLKKLTDIDRSFSDAAKRDFVRVIEEAETDAGSMSDAEFYLLVSKAVALADNGHSNISDQPLQRQFNSIGAKLYWFADGLYVVRASEAHSNLVGSRVTAIEGRPVNKVVSTLRQYRGGPDSWRRLAMPMMIETPAIMHAADLAGSPDSITFTVENAGGELRDVTLPGQVPEGAADLPFRRGWMTLKPKLLPDEDDGWVRSLDSAAEDIDMYLTDTHAPLYKTLSGNGHYIRTMTGFGTDNQSVAEFLEEALAGVADASLDYLVVDNRWNAGGDYLQSIAFAKNAPAKVKDGGKLYIIVGPQTFSAAVVSTAMIKYYGGQKAIIVGSPMGDREQFWAERGMGFELPNSGFPINYATGYHDWEKGCKGEKYCYTLNLEHEVPAGSLRPSHIIDPTYAEYASGRDKVMDWIASVQYGID